MGTSPLCPPPPPHPPGSWYSSVHVLNTYKSCSPSRGRTLPTSFTWGFCSTVQYISDHSVSLLCLHNFLLSSGTVRAAEISVTYSSFPCVGRKIPKGKHKTILLQRCAKRCKWDLYCTWRLESSLSSFSLTFISNTKQKNPCY